MIKTYTHHRTWHVLLAGAAALTLAMGMGRFMYTPMLPLMQLQADLSLLHSGYIASANYIGYLLGALLPLSAWASARRQLCLRAGLVLSVFALAAMSLDLQWWFWLGMRFVAGFASALVMIYASGLVLDVLAAAGLQRASGLLFAGVGLGMVTSSLLTLLLMQYALPWSVGWIMAAAIGLPCAAWAWWGLGAKVLMTAVGSVRSADHQVAVMTSRQTAPRKLLLWLLLAYGLAGYGYIISATYLPIVLSEHADRGQLAWLWAGVMAIPSTACWGWLGQRWPTALVLFFALMLQAVGVLLPVLLPSSLGLALSGAALGATFMGIVSLCLELARQVEGDSAKTIAAVTAVYALGQIIGPTVAAVIAEHTGSFYWPLKSASLLLLVAAAAAVRLLAAWEKNNN